MADAQRVGVVCPERVRLMKVDEIPLPSHIQLRQAAQETGLLGPDTAGLTLRYGILIRSPFWGLRNLVVHELVHVNQYEQFGGFAPFLRQYLWECITLGYAQAPLERAAQTVALRHPLNKNIRMCHFSRLLPNLWILLMRGCRRAAGIPPFVSLYFGERE